MSTHQYSVLEGSQHATREERKKIKPATNPSVDNGDLSARQAVARVKQSTTGKQSIPGWIKYHSVRRNLCSNAYGS